MVDTIELGGNIQLVNFKDIEPGKLVVIKKMVGKYTKDISEKNKEFKKLVVTLKEPDFIIEAKVFIADKEETEEIQNNNVFFALDKALGNLKGKI